MRPASLRALALVIAAGLALPACQRAAGEHAGTVRVSDLNRVAFGRTTPTEVEHLFGAPVTRDADGSLVYQLGTAPDAESVTFRFRDGVLVRVCRARS
jgi:hypothetical protein